MNPDLYGSGALLAARVLGQESASPVVALHGLASGGVSWLPALGPLAAAGEARVWLPDLLGHGASPWPADAPYDIRCHVAALASWLAAAEPGNFQGPTRPPGCHAAPEPSGAPGPPASNDLGPAPARPLVLAGCSLGAVLAAEWAARLPAGRVQAVVLVCVPLFEGPAEAAATFARADAITWLTLRRPRLAEALCRRTCGPHGLATRLSRHLVADPWRHGHAWRAFPEATFLHSWESLSRTLHRCLVEHRAQPAIRALAARGTRLTILHGSRDRLAPFQAARALAAEVGAHFVALPGATHAVQLTHPAAIRHAVADVLYKRPP